MEYEKDNAENHITYGETCTISFKEKNNRVYQFFKEFFKTQQAKDLGLVNKTQHVSLLLERSHQFALIEQFENIEYSSELLNQKTKEYTDYIDQINNLIYLKTGMFLGFLSGAGLSLTDFAHAFLKITSSDIFLSILAAMSFGFVGLLSGFFIGVFAFEIKNWFKKRNKTSQKIKSDIRIIETKITQLKDNFFQSLNEKKYQYEIMAIVQHSQKIIEDKLSVFDINHLSAIENRLHKAFINDNKEEAFNQIREFYTTIHNLDHYYIKFINLLQEDYDKQQKDKEFNQNYQQYLNQIEEPKIKHEVDYKIKELL